MSIAIFFFILFYLYLAQVILLLVGVMKEEENIRLLKLTQSQFFAIGFIFKTTEQTSAALASFKIKMCLLSFSSETCAENRTNTDRKKAHVTANCPHLHEYL